MIRMLLEARDPETGEALDREALRNEAAVIFMAGHETTANSLAWTWFLLSQAPEVEARLHAELAEVLGGPSADPRRRAAPHLHARGIRGGDPALSAGTAARPPGVRRRKESAIGQFPRARS